MTSPQKSPNPPRGMRDFYPEDMVLQTAIYSAWTAAAHHFGFVQYDACVVETLDLLVRKAGEEIVDQIYAFKDKSGRDLALRPEMTPTLARMVAARQNTLTMPLKWFTIAQCFRYERTTRGRKREHYQLNLDIIGHEGVAAEAEVVAAAADALSRLGLGANDYAIRFSSRALLGELLLALGIESEHHAATFLALDKRGKIRDDQIADLLAGEGLPPAGIDKVFDLLAIDTLDHVADRLDAQSDALAQMRSFLARIDAYGLADLMCFDISVIRGLAYYTGIVFEAFDTGGKFRALFGGGRYDNLLGDIGGSPATGVGLGFGDVVVAELLADKGIQPNAGAGTTLAVGFMTDAEQETAVQVAHAFRTKGIPVDLALNPEKPRRFFSRTGNAFFAQAVYIGPDDVAAGQIRVKDLAERQEKTVTLQDLLASTQ